MIQKLIGKNKYYLDKFIISIIIVYGFLPSKDLINTEFQTRILFNRNSDFFYFVWYILMGNLHEYDDLFVGF